MKPLSAFVLLWLIAVITVFVGDDANVLAEVEIQGCTLTIPSNSEVFDPSIVADKAESVCKQIRSALDAGQQDEALHKAKEALKIAKSDQAIRLHWLAARASRTAEEAVPHYLEVSRSTLGLSRWARLRIAELIVSTDAQIAVQEAELLMDDWAGQDRARTVLARGLADLDRTDEAEKLLQQMMDGVPSNQSGSTTAMPLAKILAGKKRIESTRQAILLLRRVATRAPMTAVGKQAEEQSEALLTTLPVKERKDLRELPVEDKFYKGSALFDAREYSEAEKIFSELAEQLKKNKEAYCRARLQQGRALLLQRKREQGAELLSQTAKSCSDPDTRAWMRYYAGRAYTRIAQPEAGIEQFTLLEAEAPSHRLADDALYKSALAAKDANDEEGFIKRLQALPEKYPAGDMKSEARFMLVMHERDAKQYDKALAQLDKLIQEGPSEHTDGMQGRARYFRARTLVDMGNTSQAKEEYTLLVLQGPFYYYSQQALKRLLEIDPAHANQLLGQLKNTVASEKLTFVQRPEMHNDAFKRALELLFVGETEMAIAELTWMGAMGEQADKNMLWLVASLLHHAEAYKEATGLVRRRLPSFMTTAPKGKALNMWRIAYPNAYHPLIETVAKDAGIPASFVRAVVREESSFDPQAVSTAHAYGLIQLIRPTARQHARQLGLPSDPNSLKRPEINLAIGANFIKYLWNRYKDNPAVIPAAYNAGHNAADRWLNANPDLDLDIWIEEIPYFETRRYTRRVLQTYGIYCWLDEERLPELKARLPIP